MTTNVIEDYIEDQSFSPFPQLLNTERPDRVSANLMEKGRVALFLKEVLLYISCRSVSFPFINRQMIITAGRFQGLFYRIIRFMSLRIAILLPAYYIAVVSFHTEVIPHDIFPVIKRNRSKSSLLPRYFEACLWN